MRTPLPLGDSSGLLSLGQTTPKSFQVNTVWNMYLGLNNFLVCVYFLSFGFCLWILDLGTNIGKIDHIFKNLINMYLKVILFKFKIVSPLKTDLGKKISYF